MAKANYQDLQDVYFYYTRVAEPAQKWQTTEDIDKEYTVTVVVSKEQFNEFVKQFPKKKTAPIENEDFIVKYKTQPPFPNQPMQYVLKFKQSAFKKNKATGVVEPIADWLRPRVFTFTPEGTQTEITNTLIGNMSKGTVRFSVWTPSNSALGASTNLYAMLVTDLVPYEKADPKAFA